MWLVLKSKVLPFMAPSLRSKYEKFQNVRDGSDDEKSLSEKEQPKQSLSLEKMRGGTAVSSSFN